MATEQAIVLTPTTSVDPVMGDDAAIAVDKVPCGASTSHPMPGKVHHFYSILS